MSVAKSIITGDTFGRLTVISELPKFRRRRFLLRCSCGKEKEVLGQHLLSGATSSCGCLMAESSVNRFRKHGHASAKKPSSTYAIWVGMIQRCENSSNKAYRYYGARGIKICKRWRESFDNFLADMGERPLDRSIDRIDNDGNYEPGNCRWATRKEQANNKHRRQPVVANCPQLPEVPPSILVPPAQTDFLGELLRTLALGSKDLSEKPTSKRSD